VSVENFKFGSTITTSGVCRLVKSLKPVGRQKRQTGTGCQPADGNGGWSTCFAEASKDCQGESDSDSCDLGTQAIHLFFWIPGQDLGAGFGGVDFRCERIQTELMDEEIIRY
jgi:hypothetical protein